MAEVGVLLLGGLVALAALGGVLARALRLPSTAAYVAIGLLARPFLPSDEPLVRTVLLLALALLLFAAGARFAESGLAARHLRSGLVLGLVPAAIVGVSAAAFAADRGWGGTTWPYVAAAAGFSSTLLLVEWLALHDERQEAPAGSALAALLVQDVLMVLALALLPAAGDAGELWRDAVNFLVLLVAAAVVGWVLRRPGFWGHVTEVELRVLTAFALALGFMLLAATLRVPPVAGAFLAGLVVAPFPARVHVRPAVNISRDFFTPLFLVVLGLSFPLPLPHELPFLALLAFLVVVAKPVLVALVSRAAGLPARTGARIAAATGQASEFALPLVLIGAEVGHLAVREAALLGWLVALSMLLSVLLRTPLERTLSRLVPTEAPPSDAPTRDHIVLLGAGMTGRLVAQRLAGGGAPLLAIDLDGTALARLPSHVARMRGDVADPELLEKAGVAHARAVVLLLRSDEMTREVLGLLKDRVPPSGHRAVIFRAQDVEEVALEGSSRVRAIGVGDAVADAIARRIPTDA